MGAADGPQSTFWLMQTGVIASAGFVRFELDTKETAIHDNHVDHCTTLSWPKHDFPLELLLPNREIMPWSPICPRSPLYPIFYFAAFLVCLVFGEDRANPSASFQGVTEKFLEYMEQHEQHRGDENRRNGA